MNGRPFKPKFGLCTVNRESGSFERTPKSSVYFYKELIENNGFSQEILLKYLKEIPSLDPSIKYHTSPDFYRENFFGKNSCICRTVVL